MRINLSDNENVEPNMAPMLDCIFLLLIFFLVATSFDKEKKTEQQVEQLNIVLPESAAGFNVASAKTNPLVIGVNRRGRFFFNNERIGVNELHQLLRNQAKENPNKAIRIDGDKNTPLQHIVHLMDLCAFEGLLNVGVRTHAGKK